MKLYCYLELLTSYARLVCCICHKLTLLTCTGTCSETLWNFKMSPNLTPILNLVKMTEEIYYRICEIAYILSL
jgi:hypothetical protein